MRKSLILTLVLIFSLSFAEIALCEKEEEDFVDIQSLDPAIRLDIRYATKDNFTGQVVYPCARCLLRKDVAEKLILVHRRLKEYGYGLKIYDCYRPVSVQKKFWEILPDERYVANPAKGSRHNRGSAVDVGLTDGKGKDLPMPTEYDDFSEKSHRGYAQVPEERRQNSLFLEEAMKREGFIPFPTEWWHFDFPGWENYPISDRPLCQDRM